jgi:hypothetical protein
LNQITKLENYLGYVWMEDFGAEGRGGLTFSLLNCGHYEMLFKINQVRVKYYMIIYHVVLQKILKYRFSPPKPSSPKPSQADP